MKNLARRMFLAGATSLFAISAANAGVLMDSRGSGRMRMPTVRQGGSGLASTLILSSYVFKIGATGAPIASVKGMSTGSNLQLTDNAGGAVSLIDGSLFIGASAPTGATSFPVTIREIRNGQTFDNTFLLVAATTDEAVSYFSRMLTKPVAAMVQILDTLIATLRASTAWAKMDGFFYFNQDTYQGALLNMVASFPLRMTGSPVFAARGGITGATGASLTNGVVLAEGTLTNFTLNSGHIGAYITAAGSATSAIIGQIAGFTSSLQPRSASGNFGATVNNATTMASAVATRVGHSCASRTGAAASAIYRNGGAPLTTSGAAPTTLPNSALYVFRTDGNYATDTVSAYHFGGGLTQAENQTVYDALTAANNAVAALGTAPTASTTDFDVVIYGATLSGLMAAQRASNRGARVVIVEPTAEIGGVGHHGLTYFDLGLRGSYQFMNNLTNAFFVAVNKVYTAAATTPAQKAEPKVYDQVFASTLASTRATVILSSPLVTVDDVRMAGTAITGIRTANGWITGRQFIDCSYEMDLAALAGAPYQVGREPAALYGEPSAGFYAKRTADGGFNYSTDGVTPNNGYPVSVRPPFVDGTGDNYIQPMSFRFPITTATDRLPFPVPPGGYNASKMDQFVAVLVSKNVQQFASVIYIGGDTALQNNKFCINGSQANIIPSLELPAVQAAYPNGTPAQRQAVIDELRSWTLHVLYCLQNDPRISASLRNTANTYGLCNDEFVNNPIKGFPNMPYIRESRRLKGKYVVTQFDVYSAVNPLNTTGGVRSAAKTNRVGQWNYILDSHAMAIYPDGTNNIVITGNVDPKYSEVDTWDVPYSSLHTDPLAVGHVSNLLVPQSFSTTSVAWMTARLEPNFAQLGEAAGEAAMIAQEYGLDVSAVPYDRLSRRIGSPINSGVPTITGTAQVGQTLSGTDGTWLYSPTTFAYVWKSGATTLATTATYTPVAADAGKTITRHVYAANANSMALAVSAPVTIAA